MEVPGLLKVFIKFLGIPECKKAQHSLTGGKFSNCVVVMSYFDPDKYQIFIEFLGIPKFQKAQHSLNGQTFQSYCAISVAVEAV